MHAGYTNDDILTNDITVFQTIIKCFVYICLLAIEIFVNLLLKILSSKLCFILKVVSMFKHVI